MSPQNFVVLSSGQKLMVKLSDDLWGVFDYEDVLRRMEVTRSGRSKRSRTLSAKASRHINLLCRAIKTGKWTTGATVDTVEVSKKLRDLLRGLSDNDVVGLTDKAKDSLHEVFFEEGLPENIAIDVYKAGEQRWASK